MRTHLSTFWWMPILLLAPIALCGAKDLPPIRSQAQLNEETRIWVRAIRKVVVSGKPVSIFNDSGPMAEKHLKIIVGPHMPLDLVKYVWIRENGAFGLKFKKKYAIDVPLKAGGYIRIKAGKGEISGKLNKSLTVKKRTPVQLLLFKRKHSLQIDKLGPNRKSIVPAYAKLLGYLPHIVCLLYLERKGVPYAAPQMDGKGASENDKSIKDLLKINDTIPPFEYLAKDS